MRCTHCNEDATWCESWTGPANDPQRRYLCEHHHEMYHEVWRMGNGYEGFVMAIARSIPSGMSCSYCDKPATGVNGHGTYFCDCHGEMWMNIVFPDGKWLDHPSGGWLELAMLTMVAEDELDKSPR